MDFEDPFVPPAFGKSWSTDPTCCNCGNLCNRTSGRGACPCLIKGGRCSSRCTCGTKKQKCTNRDDDQSGREEEARLSDEVWKAPPGEQSSEETEVSNSSHSEGRQKKRKASKMKVKRQGKAEKKTQFKKSSKRVTLTLTKRHRKEPEPSTADTSDAQLPEPSPADTSGAQLNDIQEQTTRMDEVSLRDRVVRFFDNHQDMWDEFCGHPARTVQPPSPPSSPPAGDNPDWCNCGCCQNMPTPEEDLCCRRNRQRGRCVTLGEEFTNYIVNRGVLAIAVANRNDVFAQNDDPNNNDTLRHTAYRQYVLWRHGRLGAGNRVVIPACVVLAVRNVFPSADGRYVGFRPTRLN